ncbi:MAG: hypothetical protein ABH950_02275 [Candidatus Altiarchaeota archaeon]
MSGENEQRQEETDAGINQERDIQERIDEGEKSSATPKQPQPDLAIEDVTGKRSVDDTSLSETDLDEESQTILDELSELEELEAELDSLEYGLEL